MRMETEVPAKYLPKVLSVQSPALEILNLLTVDILYWVLLYCWGCCKMFSYIPQVVATKKCLYTLLKVCGCGWG